MGYIEVYVLLVVALLICVFRNDVTAVQYTTDSYDYLDEIDDICASNPCKNGGICSSVRLSDSIGYRCKCQTGFIGQDCETANACSVDLCGDGVCSPNDGSYSCQCPPGRIGQHCEIEDPCSPNPCLYEGNCSVISESFRCSCHEGYSGQICEITPDPCTSTPCENNGQCTAVTETQYVCTCSKGFTGSNCEIFLDPCLKKPCSSGATCYSNQLSNTSYSCACAIKTGSESCIIAGVSDTLKKAGASSGKLQVGLVWFQLVDLDLHVVQPNDVEIFFENPSDSTTGGSLQDDEDSPYRVENIYWTKPLSGHYKVNVARWSSRTVFGPVDFVIVVNKNGAITQINSSINFVRGSEANGTLFYEFDI